MFVKSDGKQYVCFDQKTGEIFSIGPSIEEGYQYIEVTWNEIEPIKSYKEKMTDYIVAYNRTLKKFVLKKVVHHSYEDSFRKIPLLQDDAGYDVVLEVDKSKNICYINTDYELLKTMKNTNVDINAEVSFSFTKKNNPHVLYSMVKFKLGENKNKPISIFDDYSVYTDSDMANCAYREI